MRYCLLEELQPSWLSLNGLIIRTWNLFLLRHKVHVPAEFSWPNSKEFFLGKDMILVVGIVLATILPLHKTAQVGATLLCSSLLTTGLWHCWSWWCFLFDCFGVPLLKKWFSVSSFVRSENLALPSTSWYAVTRVSWPLITKICRRQKDPFLLIWFNFHGSQAFSIVF
jgi:hypothetical protein